MFTLPFTHCIDPTGCTPMSGSIEVDNDREHYVTSPGYMYDRAYEAFSQCNWWIQVGANDCTETVASINQ